MNTLPVNLGDRSYPIYIGTALLDNIECWRDHIHGHQVMVVSNSNIADFYLSKLKNVLLALNPRLHLDVCILPEGEVNKTLDGLKPVFEQLLENKHNRTTTLIALGGGVIGDMTGFAAACYQRGVNFIQVPTSLLAQVDSSVGGKTGVNHPLGKNMIGAFYQPQCVIIDTHTLKTLPAKEIAAGLAEVIKYGLLGDADFFTWLENNIDALMALEEHALAYAIAHACKMKADIVVADEKEQGQRALLNLGHTFGHAIETSQAYGTWLHGEAVAVGMHMAAHLSCLLGYLTQAEVNKIKQLLERAQLPVWPPSSMTAPIFIKHMQVDKKVLDGQLRLVLLHNIGNAIVTSDFEHAKLEQTLQYFTRPSE